MTADGPVSDWTKDAIGFLAGNLPSLGGREGWEHMFSTAYQVGCMALVALGQAEETEWGAIPREVPALPQVLPRWDDVCVAVLWLATQQGKLGYRLADGGVPPSRSGGFRVVRIGAPPPPAPNIAAAHGLGPARAEPDALPVLRALGLVAQGAWTGAAEPVLWRDQPDAWDLDVSSDPRFAKAVEQALATLPAEIGAEMDRLAEITDADVAAAVARHEAAAEESRARHGPKALPGRPLTTETARRTAESSRRHALDWLFFCRWRLPDGWLSPQEATRALGIFHDRLAQAMRRAMVARRYPHLPVLTVP